MRHFRLKLNFRLWHYCIYDSLEVGTNNVRRSAMWLGKDSAFLRRYSLAERRFGPLLYKAHQNILACLYYLSDVYVRCSTRRCMPIPLWIWNDWSWKISQWRIYTAVSRARILSSRPKSEAQSWLWMAWGSCQWRATCEGFYNIFLGIAGCWHTFVFHNRGTAPET